MAHPKKKKLSLDGFVNIQKGLGTAKDAQGRSKYSRTKLFTNTELNILYSTNWLANSVVDVPVEDSLRNWREITSNNAEEIEKEEKRLNLRKSFEIAEKWAKVFGGAAIVIVSDDDTLDKPLNINALSIGGVKRLVVLDRYNLIADTPNTNILSDRYGESELYTVARGGEKVHYTRVMRFDGEESTIEERTRNNYWGNSIYEKLYAPIENSQSSTQLINGLLYESNIDVYKIKGLNQLVANGQDALVVKRIQMAHELKSTVNGIVLDADDDFVKNGNTFAGLADIDDKMLQKVSGASHIPVTKLLGIAPSGLNSTGESDLRNYYDNLSTIQESKYSPKLKFFDDLMTMSVFGKVQEVDYEWASLWQKSDKETSDTRLVKAQTDNIYLNNGVLEDDEVRSTLGEYYELNNATEAEE